MILRPFSLKKIEKSIVTLSPKGLKKPSYIRLKDKREKSSKGGRSLCSIQTYRQSSSLGNKRMLSHRKLISASSLEPKPNLTQRKLGLQQQGKCTIENQNIISQRNTSKELINRPKFHLNKFRGDKLYTIQNEQTEQIQRVLQIKENILKQFIDRFQQQLKQINQQKSSRKTLLTQRIKTENAKDELTKNLKEQTTKKQRINIKSIQSNRQTVDLNKCIAKENGQSLLQIQKNKFQDYIKQIKGNKKRDQKIFVMKNHKKSLQNISISKIGQTQNITSRLSKIQTKNKMNLKQLFRHSKKYEPYLKDSETICLNRQNSIRVQQIQEKQSKLQKSSFIASPIAQKQNIPHSPSYADCSSIQKINQSSFISQIGRKSILKHFQNQSVKMLKQQNRKTKKCLAKMKNIFPSDFF